ncbi:MAG: hypothetical protein IT372_32115 [Polyangiaceae bacterium]|nr:hypothetical protein [Polyangiaceae bacterium]
MGARRDPAGAGAAGAAIASERGRARRARGRVAALLCEARERASAWRAAARRARREHFTWVSAAEELPAGACAESTMWCDQIFTPEASPHLGGRAPRRGYHVARARTMDLIRYEYEACGLELVVTEGRNFVLVEVGRAGPEVLGGGARRRAAIERIAGLIFRDGMAGELGRPRRAGREVVFEVNPRRDPLLQAGGAQRAEVGVAGGRLYFVRYKKLPQRVGFLNARQWFGDEVKRSGRR